MIIHGAGLSCCLDPKTQCFFFAFLKIEMEQLDIFNGEKFIGHG
jgi:hypothetical protein